MYSRSFLSKMCLAVLFIVLVGAGCAPAETETASPTPLSAATESPAQPLPTSPAPSEPERVDLRIVVAGEITNMDPHTYTDSSTVPMRNLIYDSLVHWDEKGDPIPALAESWEVLNDNLTYVFHLRSGVTFHDGTPVTAQAVKASFDRLLDPNRATPASTTVNFLDRAEVVDESTVALITKFPYPLTMKVLGIGCAAIVSPSDIETYGADIIQNPVGTGPYRFIEWLKGDRLVVERNPDYWGEDPAFNTITYRVAPEASVRLTALLNHEADLVELIALNDLNVVSDNPELQLISGGGARTMFIRLDTSGPPFDDVRVRQAVNYAVDKQSIVDTIMYGGAQIADSPVAPVDFGYVSVNTYPYDPNKARELLEEANFDFSQSILLIHPTGRYYFDKEITEAVQAMLGDVGINTEVNGYTDFAQYLDIPKDTSLWDMVFTSWYPPVTDADGALYLGYHSKPEGSFNYGFYSNPRVDELLDAARGTLDEDARLKDYEELQKIIMEDAPNLLLHYQIVYAGADSHLKGVRYYPIERLSVKWAYWEE